MSAFIVNKTHLDYLLTAGMSGHGFQQSPLRWMAPAEEVPAEVYERGEPWGPDAVEHYRQRARELTGETAGRVGAMLAAENRRSVDHRYNETEMEEFYMFRRYRGSITPVQTIKAIHCYVYQSCEHPEWETSEAHAFCQALEHAMIQRLPGYDEANWEIPPAEELPRKVRS